MVSYSLSTLHSNVLTHADAIETDIARLLQLITTWPATFPHLNAARNFVQQWSYTHHFHYTGWQNVEPRRFGLFVNFATAKRGRADGLFKLTGTKSPTLPRPMVIRAAAEKKEHAAKIAAWVDYTTHGNDSDRADSPSSPSSTSVGSDESTAPSLTKSAGSENTLIDLEEEAEPVEQNKARVDPFKVRIPSLLLYFSPLMIF